MKKHGKRYDKAKEMVKKGKDYPLEEAMELLQQFPKPKFDETVNMSFHLAVDPKHADQMVRGTVVLPRGTGKTVKVLVFAQGDKAKEAEEAGADYVGYKDFVEKIKGGWLDFDVAIATPDTMPEVGKLGRILGPKGLMPSPKAGTVTPNVGKAVKEVKAGRVEFKVDKHGNLHFIIGKGSFPKDHLVENALAVVDAVAKARPATLKGQYVKSVHVSPCMGPSIPVDLQSLDLR